MEKMPSRVVSLVPSVTESMFVLGLGDSLVGITDFCIYPEDKVSSIPKVGGTKNPDLEKINALQPDLVIANREENTQAAVESLRAFGIEVLLRFPRTVDQALEDMYELAGLFRQQPAMLAVESLARAVDYARAASETQTPIRYFCPIWRAAGDSEGDWWMTFNRDTYSHDLLKMLGGENIFKDRERLYPLAADLGQGVPQNSGERDVRYQRVTTAEIKESDPDLILLPSEPFHFNDRHLAQVEELFGGTSAVRKGRVRLIDGSLITWHGVRMAQAIRLVPALLLP